MTPILCNGAFRTSLIALFGTALVTFFAVGCQDSMVVEPSATPESEAATQSTTNGRAHSGGAVKNFAAPLSGDQEVPSVETNATGLAKFKLNKDGTALGYKLNVANIQEVTQAHIHCGAADVNGPVVAFLFGFEEDGVTVNGTLAEGTVTASDVIPRPDSDVCPGGIADFDELLEKMRAGETYANVHTNDNPAGEIRGQIDRGNGVAP